MPGGSLEMFIDYLMNICDRIIRQAAEDNPSSLCLRNLLEDGEEKDDQPQTAAN